MRGLEVVEVNDEGKGSVAGNQRNRNRTDEVK